MNVYRDVTVCEPVTPPLQRLLFEAADCGPAERLKRLVDQCEQVGVSLVGGAQRDDG